MEMKNGGVRRLTMRAESGDTQCSDSLKREE
jgi:hypothetical protein